MLYVEKTIPEHCFLLAPNLKALDRYEIALWGLDPLQALLQPFRYSRPNVNSFTILTKDHKIAAIFGAVPINNVTEVGAP